MWTDWGIRDVPDGALPDMPETAEEMALLDESLERVNQWYATAHLRLPSEDAGPQ